VHLVDRFVIPADWTRYWSVDFGYIHPFVAQWWAVDPDGNLYLYRELVHTKRLVEDHAKQMLAQVITDGAWTEPKPKAILTDHAAEDRATLEKHLGLKTKPAKKTVSDGLQAVESRFKVSGNGKPRLMIMKDSLIEIDSDLAAESKPIGLAEEIPGYVWADHKTKEMPVKVGDDACDCCRYVVAHLDLAGKSTYNVRSLG
jgi:phage terminase large subunit